MQITLGQKTVWLNYHHLYYFKLIATEGSIARAAEKLKLGQPTLSAQLRQFEEQLDVRLFERQHKKLILTETGKLVLAYANDIFRLGGELIEVIHDRRLPNRTHVQIGTLDSVPKHLILSLVKKAYEIGDCTVSILEGKPDEMLRELSQHRIDLFVTNFVPAAGDGSALYSRRIARAPVLVCAAPKYRSLRKGFPKSMHQKPFVLPTLHSKLRHDIEHYFKLAGIQMDIVAETQDTAIQKLMGIEGLGLVPVPLPAVQDYLRKKELVEIGCLENVYEELFLVATSRKIENPISSRLMKSFVVE